MLKWLLRWVKSDAKTGDGSPLTQLYDGDRGIDDLHDNNAELRLWLPEPLRMALDQTARELGTSESQYLREFLTVYLYGVHEILRMNSNKTGLYFVPPPQPDSDTRFSKAAMSEVIPGLGKNIIACKLRLPSKIKADLRHLAEQKQVPLGRFVREILVQHFLGHTVWPNRFQDFPTEQKIADGWVDGQIEAIRIRSEEFDPAIDKAVESFW